MHMFARLKHSEFVNSCDSQDLDHSVNVLRQVAHGRFVLFMLPTVLVVG